MAFFGGKDPFDHPFFTQNYGGSFGPKNPFDDPFFISNFDSNSGSRKQISIEELNTDDDDGVNEVKSRPNKELSLKDSDEYPSGICSSRLYLSYIFPLKLDLINAYVVEVFCLFLLE